MDDPAPHIAAETGTEGVDDLSTKPPAPVVTATRVTNPDPNVKLATATPTVVTAPTTTTPAAVTTDGKPVVVTPAAAPTGSQVVAVAGDTGTVDDKAVVVDDSTDGTTDTVVQPRATVVKKPRQTMSVGRHGTLEVHYEPEKHAYGEAPTKKPSIMEMLEAPSAFNTWVKFYDQVKNCVKVLTGEEQLFL